MASYPTDAFEKNANPFNFLIVHGVEGYPAKNWYGQIGRRLEAQGHNVIVPQFPTKVPVEPGAPQFPNGRPPELSSYAHQTLAAWTDVAHDTLKNLDPARTILVGHSLGGLFVLRLAEMFGQEKPFRDVLAISPVGGALGLPDYDPYLTSFYEGADWGKIRDGSKNISVFSAPDDAVVPYAQSKRLADLVGAEFVKVEGGGHINAASGYHDLPHLYAYLDKAVGNYPARLLPQNASASIESPSKWQP